MEINSILPYKNSQYCNNFDIHWMHVPECNSWNLDLARQRFNFFNTGKHGLFFYRSIDDFFIWVSICHFSTSSWACCNLQRSRQKYSQLNKLFNIIYHIGDSLFHFINVRYSLKSSVLITIITYPLVGYNTMPESIAFFFVFMFLNILYLSYLGQLLAFLVPSLQVCV